MADLAKSTSVNASSFPAEQPAAAPVAAPMWHTALLVFILLGLSALSWTTSRRFAAPSSKDAEPRTVAMVASYSATLIEEWFLFFFVFWGERMRGHIPVRENIGVRTEKDALWRDIGIAALVWGALLVIGGILNFLLHPPGREVVAKLLPHNLIELALWAPLAISAGFCEEYIFRGYLMRQFSILTGSIWLALVIQAAIFGLAHGYQGPKSMLIIFCYGIVFGVATKLRKSLRPGMFAHGWLDFESGFLGFILHLLKIKLV